LQQIEIICIDDGSSDCSLEIVSKYAEKESRIKVLHQNNAGVSTTRNRGIMLAKGQFVCFLDADDIWIPNFLTDEKIEKWKNEQFDIISYKEVNSNEDMTAFSIPISREEKVVDGGADSIWCVSSHMGACFYKREMLMKYKIRFQENLKYGEDGLFRLCCMYFANRICIKDEVMYIYRQNQTGAMHQRKQSAIMYYMQIVKGYMKLQEFCNSFNLFDKGEVKIGKTAVGIYYVDMAKEHFQNLGSLRELKEAIEKSQYYDEFNSLTEKDVPEQYWKWYQFLNNNIRLFQMQSILKGCILGILKICLRIPIIRKMRERKLYQGENLLRVE
jgi:glycosyltransferase involved in cell wall biosynthesis